MLWSSVYSYLSDTKHPSETRGPAAVAGAPSKARPRPSSGPLPSPRCGAPTSTPPPEKDFKHWQESLAFNNLAYLTVCEKMPRVKQIADIQPPKPDPTTQAGVGWEGGWPKESDQLCSQAVRGPAQPPNSWPWPWALGTWLPQLWRVF